MLDHLVRPVGLRAADARVSIERPHLGERRASSRIERDHALGTDRGAAPALFEARAELGRERRIGSESEVGDNAGEEEPWTELRREQHLVQSERPEPRGYGRLAQQE